MTNRDRNKREMGLITAYLRELPVIADTCLLAGVDRAYTPRRLIHAIAAFTVSTSCFIVKGFGRNWKPSPSGRFLRKASSA